MINGIYGTFSDEQITKYKKKLHSKIHWLLIYKEADDYEYFNNYFINLMREINSLGSVFNNQEEVIELLVTLQSAFEESLKKDCNFKLYRKLILDAHSLVDKMFEED